MVQYADVCYATLTYADVCERAGPQRLRRWVQMTENIGGLVTEWWRGRAFAGTSKKKKTTE